LHPSTLVCFSNFAYLLEELGKLDEAEALYRKECEGRLRRLGASHPDVKNSFDNLKRFLRAHGRSPQ
jgi:hypothetical protein